MLTRTVNRQEYSGKQCSPENKKKHLSISIKGLKEGDYAMIIGFPGSFNEPLPNCIRGEKNVWNRRNDPRIRIRGARLAVLKEVMNASDKIRGPQYANKYAGSSNWLGKNSIEV